MKDFGIVSWSYSRRQGGEHIEEKLYFYEYRPSECTVMLSNKRGILHQYDCYFPIEESENQDGNAHTSHVWYDKVNSHRQKTLEEFKLLHEWQDTVEYVDKDKFSFYFRL